MILHQKRTNFIQNMGDWNSITMIKIVPLRRKHTSNKSRTKRIGDLTVCTSFSQLSWHSKENIDLTASRRLWNLISGPHDTDVTCYLWLPSSDWVSLLWQWRHNGIHRRSRVITHREVDHAVRRMPMKKAPGPYYILPRCLLQQGKYGIRAHKTV